MKKKIILIPYLILLLALCFYSCDTGLFDDDNSSSASASGVTDGYRVTTSTQTTSDGNVYFYSYDYISGSKIDEITATLNGSAYLTTVYSYNSDDTISEITTTYSDSGYPTYKVEYSNYDSHDNYLRVNNYSDNTLSSYFTYTFEYSSGEITSSTQKGYDASGNLLSTTESTYEDGKTVKSEMSSSSFSSVSTYSYDSHGCITKSTTTGTSTVSGSSYTSTSTVSYTNEYSLVGNLIKQTQIGGTVIEYDYERY